jgi:predicted NBD/HSP70 family sugar kinase
MAAIKGVTLFDQRQQEVIRLLWQHGRLSRWELHERSGQTPNGVGNLVGKLIEIGVLRECEPLRSNGGRPRVPVELDPDKRHVVGLMISQGGVEACHLNLNGTLIGKIRRREVPHAERIVAAAARMLSESVSEPTLGIGVSAAGLIDPQAHAILLSSVLPSQRAVSLQPIYAAAGDHPLVVTNDMQALAIRWMLTHRAELDQDMLLIGFGDGALGAAMLIEGRPNRGCVLAGNELGHTRMPVETALCHCGQKGCLERICSAEFLHSEGLPHGVSMETALTTHLESAPVQKMLNLLGMGFANAVNFVRPHRLVLISDMVQHVDFCQALLRRIRSMLLTELANRVQIDLWDQPAYKSAQTAAWAALGSLYLNSWEPTSSMAKMSSANDAAAKRANAVNV